MITRPVGTHRQTTDWSYFLNGKLKTLTTKNGAGATMESHTVSYLDPGGVYVNGHRTKDVFLRKSQSGFTPCSSSNCTAAYTYDPQDRLRAADETRGAETLSYLYGLDAHGNIDREEVVTNGTTTKLVTYSYQGDQLQSSTEGATTLNYFYDALGL